MNSSVNPFFRGLSFILLLFPRWVIRLPGWLLGWLWFDVFRFRRQIVLQNLSIAFPDRSTHWKIRTGRRSVIDLASSFFEFFTLPALNRKWLERSTVLENEGHLKAALEQGRGALVLTLHMGAVDVAASLLPMNGYPSHLISKRFKTKWFNDLWFSIRGAQGMRFIEPHGERAPFEILKALKSNALVIFVLDQHMGPPYGVATTFFGRRVGTAYGLALFALKTKAPVVPVFTYEGSDGKIHLRCLEELQLEPYRDLPRDQAISQMTQLFTNVIENIVRLHPEQWMWVHRRWKGFSE